MNGDAKGGIFPNFDPVIEKANQVLDQVQALVQDVRRWGVTVNGTVETNMGTLRVDLKLRVPQA